MRNRVLVHFHSREENYFDFNIWQWHEGQLGKDSYFSRFDSFGVVADLSYEAPHFVSQVNLIVKKRDWSKQSQDYHIQREYGVKTTEVWLVAGDDQVYYSRQAAVTSPAYKRRHRQAYDMVTHPQAFDCKWGFSGWLGFVYEPDQTQFRLWAPTAERVELVLYQSTDDRASVDRIIAMERGQVEHLDDHSQNTQGVWFVTVPGDLNFQAYRYRVYYRRRTFRDSRDPYAIAATANGRRSVVVADQDLTPAGFQVCHGEAAPWRLTNPNQAVICQFHIRDFSKSPTSGVSPENRGKYLGAIERGTQNTYGDKTCFDYIRSLGISHVQLQPVFDHHQTILEDGSYAYNWGYDPENYNVPEASFASNPQAPASRILELKQLIQAYHEAGIGVIIDVVYNHTYSSRDSAFQLTVPDYYYRMTGNGCFHNGSGCGNETASEKEMFRKYMVDSVLYWAQAYNVDGFRFDLMGLHDVETMRAIRQALDEIDPRIITYGEGWDMGTGLDPHQKAKKANAYQMPGIGFFNDDVRNAIKGAEVYGHFDAGFVSGAASEDKVAKGLLGSDELNGYLTPSQVLNYVEAHDNYNLNDLLWELHPEDDQDRHRSRVQLATGMNFLMQGMTFMQLGQEFLRTKLQVTGPDGQLTQADKERAMNAYNAPDRVNQIDWNQVTRERAMVKFVKSLIKLKRTEKALSLYSYEAIRQHVYVTSAERSSGFVSLDLSGEKDYKVFFNASGKSLKINMTEQNNYAIIVSNQKRFHNQELILDDLTLTILEMTK